MKRLLRSVFLCVLPILMAACGGEQTNHVPPASEADVPLVLDNGEKWPVDDHTRESAGRLAQLVRDAVPIRSVEDAQALGGALDAELSTLIQGCTMTGPAHDQLHVFLVALFPRVGELKQETDPKKLEVVGDEMSSLFAAYEEHFD